jgi:arsenate reductase
MAPVETVLWFNPRCSTCRKALELLKQRGVDPVLRRYLEDPPTPAELETLLGKLGLPPHAIARKKEDEYQILRLSESTPREEMIQALAKHPILIERPIFVRGERAIVARPFERVVDLIGGK